MNTPTKNYEKSVEIYNQGGYSAIFDAVESGELKADSFRDCIPCEMRTPHEQNTCLCCGTEDMSQPIPLESGSLNHEIKFACASDLWIWLDENEIYAPCTLILHLGEKK